MSEIQDTDVRAMAQKNYSLVLRTAKAANQSQLAVTLGTSDTTVSRLINHHMEMSMGILAALNLRVVDENVYHVNVSLLQAVLTLAEQGLFALRSDITLMKHREPD